jgi:hypothetical protein
MTLCWVFNEVEQGYPRRIDSTRHVLVVYPETEIAGKTKVADAPALVQCFAQEARGAFLFAIFHFG